MCGAAAPYRQAPSCAQENVTAGEVLVLTELSPWKEQQTGAFSPAVKNPHGKCSIAIIPGQNSTPNRAL